MLTSEMRQYPRVKSVNLSYIYLDKNNQVIERGTGTTSNISEWGFLIKTGLELKKKYSVIASIELPEEMVELQGEVVHCKHYGSDRYLAGVIIKDISKGGKHIWKNFIERLLHRQTA